MCGIEAHVCVLQTCLDLAEDGYIVAVATDAIGSRRVFDQQVAEQRLAQAGIIPITVESAAFELVGEAGTVRFKAVLPIIDIAEKATHATEAEMRAQLHSRFSRICDSGIISTAAPGLAPWEHLISGSGGGGADSSVSTPGTCVDNGAPFARETNVERANLPNKVDLLACDVGCLKTVTGRLVRGCEKEGTVHVLRICGGNTGRCRAVALWGARAR